MAMYQQIAGNLGGQAIDKAPRQLGTLQQILSGMGSRIDEIEHQGHRIEKAMGMLLAPRPEAGSSAGGYGPEPPYAHDNVEVVMRRRLDDLERLQAQFAELASRLESAV